MSDKIPWLKNEAFNPHCQFPESLDATEEELQQFEVEEDSSTTILHHQQHQSPLH